MAAYRSGKPEGGWNDPPSPMVDYWGYISQERRGQYRNQLNKRMIYPLSSDSQPPALTRMATLLNPGDGLPCLPTVHLLPPSTTTTSPTPIPVVIPTLSPTTDPCGDCVLLPAIFSPTAATVPGVAQPVRDTTSVKDMESLLVELSLPSETALLTFVQEGLKSAVESAYVSLQQGSVEELKKKLAVMSEQWRDGILSSSVKCQLGSLVAALKKHRIREANELHLVLLGNYTSEVNQWLAAIKQIIQELSAKQSSLHVSKEKGQGQHNATDVRTASQNSILPNASSPEKLSEKPSKVAISLSSHGKDCDVNAKGGR